MVDYPLWEREDEGSNPFSLTVGGRWSESNLRGASRGVAQWQSADTSGYTPVADRPFREREVECSIHSTLTASTTATLEAARGARDPGFVHLIPSPRGKAPGCKPGIVSSILTGISVVETVLVLSGGC